MHCYLCSHLVVDSSTPTNAHGRLPRIHYTSDCPLPANLNLKAQSVQDALSDLGPVPLATIPLDTFRAMFVLPGEVRNVLQPMEHTQAQARYGGLVTWIYLNLYKIISGKVIY